MKFFFPFYILVECEKMKIFAIGIFSFSFIYQGIKRKTKKSSIFRGSFHPLKEESMVK
jgi:hypothetical protein